LTTYVKEHPLVFLPSDQYGPPILPLLSDGNDATVEETFERLHVCIEVKLSNLKPPM